jgi:hypothetical protein
MDRVDYLFFPVCDREKVFPFFGAHGIVLPPSILLPFNIQWKPSPPAREIKNTLCNSGGISGSIAMTVPDGGYRMRG